MSIAIQAENISKAYQIGEFSTGTISRDIERWWALMRGKEDPFLRIGETNDRSTKGASNVVWSLKDINFDIQQGDAVGIIGKNGAGKSTLLKVLSRVTTPTTGKVKVKGRIASLLEVGTGFHPELTGRENIFLNGAILGMRKHEIKKHFDAIVDFSGVERYIDTPVKRYSSGMYVRLAFAVAAHLESEILIVDEVLAVGDAEFQKKCLGKMSDVSKGEGRTVLFVSHNMGAINSLCSSCLLLKNGNLIKQAAVSDVISSYINENTVSGKYMPPLPDAKPILITSFKTEKQGTLSDAFGIDDDIDLKISVRNLPKNPLMIGISLLDSHKNKVFTSHYPVNDFQFDISNFECIIPKSTLCPGRYTFDCAVFLKNGTIYDYVSDICSISIVETGSDMFYDTNFGNVFVNCKWSKYD